MLTGNLSELFRGIRLFDRRVVSTSSSSSSRLISLSFVFEVHFDNLPVFVSWFVLVRIPLVPTGFLVGCSF